MIKKILLLLTFLMAPDVSATCSTNMSSEMVTKMQAISGMPPISDTRGYTAMSQAICDNAGSGTGVVSSVGLTVPSFLTVTGSPITGAGTLAISGTSTGTGSVVLSASPTLTGTPVLPSPFTLGVTSMTSSGAQLNYLNSATGTTGTASSNLVFSASPTLTNPALGTPSALVGTNISGTGSSFTAGNSTNAGTIQVSTNASFYPTFVSSSSSGNQVLDIGTGLSFNPSTNNLSCTTFTGALSGNATTATSATSATTATNLAGGSGGTIPYQTSSGTTAMLANGSAYQLLQSNGTTLSPTWVNPPSSSPLTTKGDIYTYSSTNARLPVGTNGYILNSDSTQTTGLGWIATLPVANGGTGSGTALTQYGVKYATSTTAEACTAAGTAGYPLIANSSSAPTFQQLSLTAGVTGTLPIANGGTNVTSVTTSPTASSFSGWDTNKNLSANNHIPGYTATTSAASTLTLTVGSGAFQNITGTSTEVVLLPVTSTLVTGQTYTIQNNSTGIVTVESSGANTLQAMASSTQLVGTVASTSGTGTASWTWIYTPLSQSTLAVQPTVTTYTSGSGNFTTAAGVQFLRVRIAGGGGGGSGSGTSGATSGNASTASTATTFGTSLLTASAGNGGAYQSAGGAGGAASLGSGPIGTALPGGSGQGGSVTEASAQYMSGGSGGSNAFGGGGGGGQYAGAGLAGATNTGAGGGGGGSGLSSSQNFGSAGGGAGGFVDAIVFPTSGQIFPFVVGVGGSSGGAGVAGAAGGAGAAGYVEITSYFYNLGVSSTIAGVNPTHQIFTSGSGTYTTPAGVQFIRVTVVGPGGGGQSGTGSTSQNPGGTGGASTFGTSLLNAGAGTGGSTGGTAGGAPTVTSPAIDLGSIQGGSGMGWGSGTGYFGGGMGGVNPRGGAGASGQGGGGAGGAGIAGSGAGGGGGGGGGIAQNPGGGGGAGAYVYAQINNPSSSYPYVVSGSQPGGVAGTGAGAGGVSGSGVVIVDEFYTALAIGTQAAIPAGTYLGGPYSGSAASPSFRAFQAPVTQIFNSTGTYTPTVGTLYTEVYLAGAGGQGGGSGTSGGGTGTTGGASTVSTQLTANGGAGGWYVGGAGGGGAGGTASFTGSGVSGVAIPGTNGAGLGGNIDNAYSVGGAGGNTAFFSGGGAPSYGGNGIAGTANTGGGGAGGGGGATVTFGGLGGGSGGFLHVNVTGTTLATWVATPPTVTIGTNSGAGGTPGTSGNYGGGGGTGVAIFVDHFQ